MTVPVFGRRCFAALAAAGGISVAAGASGHAQPPGATQALFGPKSWPQYRGSVTRNAVFATDGPREPVTVPAFHVGAPCGAEPVICGGRLLVGTMSGNTAETTTGTLNAFDVASGRSLWQQDVPNWVMSDMVTVDGIIYIGFGNRFFSPGVKAVRGTGASGVMAVSAETGKAIWSFKTAGEVMPTPAVRHGIVYAATGDGHLYALDARSGILIWAVRLPGFDSMSSPVLDGHFLYVGCDNSFVAVNLLRRALAWTFNDYTSFTDVPPALGGGTTGPKLIVTTGVKNAATLTREEKATYPASAQQDNHFIYAFNEKGIVVWKDLLGFGPAQANNTSGAPAIANGKVFVGSPYTSAAYAYDLATGRRLWRRDAGAGIKGPPAITGGKVYFGDFLGRLHVVEEATGHQLNRVQLGTRPLAPWGPVIVNDVLFMASQDGMVYARSLRDLASPLPEGDAKKT